MIELNEEQSKRLLDFCCMTDLEFYEKHLADLTLEEQAAFMEEFPDFLSNRKAEESDLGRKWDIQIYKSRGYVGVCLTTNVKAIIIKIKFNNDGHSCRNPVTQNYRV